MWSFFQSSFSPSAKWYQSTSSNSTKQATHYNTPKPVIPASQTRPDLEKLGARPAFYRISYRKGEDSPLEQLAVALGSWERIDQLGSVLPSDPASSMRRSKKKPSHARTRIWPHAGPADSRSR